MVTLSWVWQFLVLDGQIVASAFLTCWSKSQSLRCSINYAKLIPMLISSLNCNLCSFRMTRYSKISKVYPTHGFPFNESNASIKAFELFTFSRSLNLPLVTFDSDKRNLKFMNRPLEPFFRRDLKDTSLHLLDSFHMHTFCDIEING